MGIGESFSKGCESFFVIKQYIKEAFLLPFFFFFEPKES